MNKDFDKWNNLKKKVESRLQRTLFNEREVWWCSLGLNIGSEQDGVNEYYERPVLIFKKFNLDLAWILPLTKTIKDNVYYFRLIENDSSVVLSQIKLISSRRLLRKIRSISKEEFTQIRKAILNIILEINS